MITFLLLTALYFLPTLIAAYRGHPVTGILLLNLFFGWTGIVWFALLLWALLSAPRYRIITVPQYYPYAGWRP